MILGKRKERNKIDERLEELKGHYTALTEEKRLPGGVMRAFEDRYMDALRIGLDLSRFLDAEEAAMADIYKRLENSSGSGKIEPGDEDGEPEETFIERITREIQERIEEYPSAVLPYGASFEMEKLAGMLMQFGRVYWPEVENILRKLYPVSRPEARIALETMVFEYCMPTGFGLPRFLDRYIKILSDGAETQAEREEQRCIAGAARFLGTIKGEVFSLRSQNQYAEGAEILARAEEYLQSALENFRMKDLRLLK